MDKMVVFGFSRPIKFKIFARLIQWSEGINFNHGYAKFLGSSTNFIYQATGHGTNFKSQNSFDKENISVEEYGIFLSQDDYDRLLKTCADREGSSYGVFQVIGKGICQAVLILTAGNIKLKNPFTEYVDCIEELSMILSQALGVECPMDMNTVTVKPFHDWVSSLSQLRKIK